MQEDVKQFLDNKKIDYILHKHPPVMTCEEAEKHCTEIPGLSCKNLFMKDKKSNYFLVILPASQRLDLKLLTFITRSKKIVFANDEELLFILGLKRGAVSPLGLINDKGNKTKLFIDEGVWDAEVVSFHPNINTETVELKKEMFHTMVKSFGNDYSVVSL